MTSLTNINFSSVYGDVLTTTNGGSGLSSTLKQLQDGFGNSSTVTIATNAINFARGGGNTFQLDGVALTASATDLNSVASSSGNLTALQALSGVGFTTRNSSGNWFQRSFVTLENITITNSDGVNGDVIFDLADIIFVNEVVGKKISIEDSSSNYLSFLPPTAGFDSSYLLKFPERLPLANGQPLVSTTDGNMFFSQDIQSSNIFQTAHGFSVGDIIKPIHNFVNSFEKAQADSLINSKVFGIVVKIINANNFEVLFHGRFKILSFALVPGDYAYLSPDVAGQITNIQPVTPGQVLKILFLATSATEGLWLNYQGTII